MEDYYLDITYKNKTVRFKVVNPDAPLSQLMNNLRHAVGSDGRLIFDFPSIDQSGAPLVLRPRIGKADQRLIDYNVKNGDKLFLIPDPFPG